MKTKFLKDHPTKNVVIKRAAVDRLCVPLVRWLNSFDSVTTLFCCQGEPRGKKETDEQYLCKKPYVLFICRDKIELITILEMFGYRGITEIDWSVEQGQLRYTTRFHDQKDMLDVIERIRLRLSYEAERRKSLMI